MAAYLTPGVYYERVDTSAPAITAVRTDVAGFVGLAVRGPLDTPVPVQSWRQFEAHFGGFSGAAFLAYAVRGFFENGGRRCWVVRAASRDAGGGAAQAAATITSVGGGDAWRVSASSPGVWGNDLSFTMKATHRAQTTTVPSASTPEASAVLSTSGFARGTLARLAQDGAPDAWKVVSDVDPVNGTLIWLHPDPRARLPYDSAVAGFRTDRAILVESLEYTLVVRESGVPVAVYENLSLVPESDTYGPRVLAPWAPPDNSDAGDTLPPPPLPVCVEELRTLPLSSVEPLEVSSDAVLACAGGADGLALLTADDFIGEESSPLDDDETRARKTRGLAALEAVSEVSVVAIPDIHVRPFEVPPRAPTAGELPPVFSEDDVYRVQAALVSHCETLRDRVALLDAPAGAALDPRLGVGAVRAWRSRFDTKYAAFYFPWLRVVDPLRGASSLTRDIPPTGHVAGQYARTDFEVGVHKAPANSPLQWTEDVTVGTDDATHGVLNPLGVNVVRVLPGRGIRVFGARTVSSDPAWRYVNVRRLLLMIEKAIFISTQWAVFEPNDTLTRNKIRLSLTSFLAALWQKGALAGDRPDAAFFVKCDDENNPPEVSYIGQVVATIGVALVAPAEFIVLNVKRTPDSLSVSEEAS